MLNTKLILIEGLPGAGKTTTAKHLGEYLQQQGINCRCYLENDDSHPIACLDLKLKDLSEKLPRLWKDFVESALQAPTVSIIESRLWQNTALFMYMDEYSLGELTELQQLVGQCLSPVEPILLYLYQDNPEMALRRLYTLRDEKWMEWALQTTTSRKWFRTRGLNDFAGWVKFFQEWQLVVEELFNDWPYRKTKIINPHDDWAIAYQEIYQFLQVDHDQ